MASPDLMTTITEQELLELRQAFQLYEEQSEDGRVDRVGLDKLLRWGRGSRSSWRRWSRTRAGLGI